MTAYYNEIDPFAAAWLRELIKAGHIAPGFVDERSIEDVRPDELEKYTQCHFFAGVAVWSYSLRQAGWPDDKPVWTGSCPCQGFSAAGRQKGFEDERHLWPVWQKLIADCRPRVIFGEQVASSLIVGAASKERDAAGWHVGKIKNGSESTWFDLVQADLERTNYASAAFDIPAAGVGSPNIRQRLFFVGVDAGVADSIDKGPQGRVSGRTNSEREDQHGHAGCDGAIGGVGYTDSEPAGRNTGSTHCKKVSDGQDSRNSDRPSDAGELFFSGLADADMRGCEQESDERPTGLLGTLLQPTEQGDKPRNMGAAPVGTSPTNGFWADADWLHCRDGKWRPVEPGTSPLVDGATNRVGRLRGYGNAINAQAAQAFIESVMEVI